MVSPSCMIERHSKDYYKAKSFDVVVEVKYRRTRKVRALDKEQAKEFDYKGTAKQAGSMARKSLIKTIGFGIREAKKIINEAKEEASK